MRYIVLHTDTILFSHFLFVGSNIDFLDSRQSTGDSVSLFHFVALNSVLLLLFYVASCH